MFYTFQQLKGQVLLLGYESTECILDLYICLFRMPCKCYGISFHHSNLIEEKMTFVEAKYGVQNDMDGMPEHWAQVSLTSHLLSKFGLR